MISPNLLVIICQHFNFGEPLYCIVQNLLFQIVIIELIFERSNYTLNMTISYCLSMLCLFFYSLLSVREMLKKALSTAKNLFSYFFVVLLQPFIKDNKQYGKIKDIGGDAGGIVLPY